MAGRRFCRECLAWVGAGIAHREGCPNRGEFIGGDRDVEVRPHDPELWDEMVEEVLGPEWLAEDRFDQLVAMVEYNGDPESAAREIEGVLD